ncbi:MAG: hypothetical protein K5675_03990 [Lachnospiraceae bacterium]|nr:hypothetical protein [Lachnospiraceae bacterium]
MLILDKSDTLKKTALITLAFSIFSMVVSVLFSKTNTEITSYYMTFLALVPFVLGFIPTFFLLWRGMPQPGFFSYHLYFFGVAALTMSCFLRGIFEITEHTSMYQVYLFYIGLVAAIIGIGGYVQMFITGKDF